MANFNMFMKATNDTGEGITNLSVQVGQSPGLQNLITETRLGAGESTPGADFSRKIGGDYTWDVSFTDVLGRKLSGRTTTPSPTTEDDFKTGTVTIFADNRFIVKFPDGTESGGTLS